MGKQGVPKENIELYDVPEDELAHYSKVQLILCTNFSWL